MAFSRNSGQSESPNDRLHETEVQIQSRLKLCPISPASRVSKSRWKLQASAQWKRFDFRFSSLRGIGTLIVVLPTASLLRFVSGSIRTGHDPSRGFVLDTHLAHGGGGGRWWLRVTMRVWGSWANSTSETPPFVCFLRFSFVTRSGHGSRRLGCSRAAQQESKT